MAKAPVPKAPPAKPAVVKAASGKAAPPPAAAPLPPAPPAQATAPKPSPKAIEKGKARDALRSRILGAKKPSKPIAFSLDEVREIAKAIAAKSPTSTDHAAKTLHSQKAAKVDLAKASAKPAMPNHVKAASLSDILGFNPRKPVKATTDDAEVPEKFRRYFKLLIDLRNHLTGQLSLHSEDTLKRSSKDDAGDLSSYGQHMADAGTDTFDRDFALSLVSSEQEALSEIEAAIQRIRTGSYGICEISQKPIAKERLLAVPFTRYSAEAQKEIERNRYRQRTGAGLFGEGSEEGGSMSSEGGGDDE
ncbi:MAG: TraR/DksA C4-type zinc finger protein [Opitutaceae bacterium]|nr:TraR/DksA C4-type zinc finger protein [Opitutaceae bacterium]